MTATDSAEAETRRVTIRKSGAGWEVREELGPQLVRAACYTDWHRVERALEILRREGYVIDAGLRVA